MILFRRLLNTLKSYSTCRHQSFSNIFRSMATSNQDTMLSSLATPPKEDKSIEPPATPGLQTDLPQAVETTNNGEIYSVKIQNNGTHIKVFMPPHMQQEMASINQKLKQKQHTYSKRPRINKSQQKMKVNDVDNSVNTATANEESSPAPEAATVVEIPESVRQYERNWWYR
mmetsp:Transcript_8578/g.20656  ORF Transcript_8578/g.20656 Transcript_8578/m.20656 type:complete len:171 (-) Transcript_8578:878-1390(-)